MKSSNIQKASFAALQGILANHKTMERLQEEYNLLLDNESAEAYEGFEEYVANEAVCYAQALCKGEGFNE